MRQIFETSVWLKCRTSAPLFIIPRQTLVHLDRYDFVWLPHAPYSTTEKNNRVTTSRATAYTRRKPTRNGKHNRGELTKNKNKNYPCRTRTNSCTVNFRKRDRLSLSRELDV